MKHAGDITDMMQAYALPDAPMPMPKQLLEFPRQSWFARLRVFWTLSAQRG